MVLEIANSVIPQLVSLEMHGGALDILPQTVQYWLASCVYSLGEVVNTDLDDCLWEKEMFFELWMFGHLNTC